MSDLETGSAGPGAEKNTERRGAFGSAAANRLVRKRYRSERIFKGLGLSAVLAVCVFLLLLFWNILGTGLPAFTQHSIIADVDVAADIVDPGGKRDIGEIRAADFFALAAAFIRAQAPDVTARRDRTKLVQLLSSGSVDDLRNAVVANPLLVGGKVRTRLILSDDADIYFKGGATRIVQTDGAGTAQAGDVRGDIKLVSSAPDFEPLLARIKDGLARQAAAKRRQAAAIEKRHAGGELAAQVAQLKKETALLDERAKDSRSPEDLSFEMPSILIAVNGGIVKANRIGPSFIEGSVLKPLTSANPAPPGAWKIQTLTTPESGRKVSDKEVVWLESLKQKGLVERHFNWRFFTNGDSREPELAGIRGAITGSILTLLVTLALCLPIGVLAAIYLEEFAPRNWLTDIIEININNLAAVPSIVFGLLGLAVFLNFFNLPRSAPLVGGFVLALLTLPTIIIASRAAIKAVPPSIREAALGVGASHQQAVFHHVLPHAVPGIMTGTIIGMAHALGETAPLLMIGMVAFIVDIPGGFTDPATVLPVQIFLWSDLPEIAFQAKTAAAIIVLLLFLFLMNGTAIVLRKRFERRW